MLVGAAQGEVDGALLQGHLDLHRPEGVGREDQGHRVRAVRSAAEDGDLPGDLRPDLRRDLEAAGLTPSRLEVDSNSGGAWLDRHSAQQQAMAQQQGFGDRGDRQGRAEARSRSWSGPADTRTDGVTSPTNRSTSSGVDYRV